MFDPFRMTNLIILPNDPLETVSGACTLLGAPVGLLDPRHPAITGDLRRAILRDRYHDDLLADGLETGHIILDNEGREMLRTSLPVFSFAGRVFEVYCVRRFNDDRECVGRNAFAWCTGRSRTKNEFFDQFKAIGTGFISTKNAYPYFYSPHDKFDIQFIRENPFTGEHEPALRLGSTRTAGIQVKATRGNEMDEIISPLLSGKYTHVITMLRHQTGMHSYYVCMDILSTMARNHQIDYTRKLELEAAILSPEMLGIDQYEIDYYYEYIHWWYEGRAANTEDVVDAIKLEITGYRYHNGVLIPPN